MKTNVNLIVLSLLSPLQIGVYDFYSGLMIKSFVSEKKTSDALPLLFDTILKEFTCKNIVFARGPGSFMAIKITYIFLRTLAITQGIRLLGQDGFFFNGNKPILAMKNLAFIKKEDGTIETEILATTECNSLKLPSNFDITHYLDETEPLYVLPAV